MPKYRCWLFDKDEPVDVELKGRPFVGEGCYLRIDGKTVGEVRKYKRLRMRPKRITHRQETH
jgi:hypothetical protein